MLICSESQAYTNVSGLEHAKGRDRPEITYQTLEDTLAGGGARGLNLPLVVLRDLIQLQLILDLVRPHGGRHVLLIGENEKAGIFHFTVGNNA